jgi:hypothetical protein
MLKEGEVEVVFLSTLGRSNVNFLSNCPSRPFHGWMSCLSGLFFYSDLTRRRLSSAESA